MKIILLTFSNQLLQRTFKKKIGDRKIGTAREKYVQGKKILFGCVLGMTVGGISKHTYTKSQEYITPIHVIGLSNLKCLICF